MNLDSKYRILCYGDSNTWGTDPQKNSRRFGLQTRWAGILQQELGSEFDVLEDGIPGRTLLTYEAEPNQLVTKSGLATFLNSVYAQLPLDLIVIALGVNDLRTHRTASMMELWKGYFKYGLLLNELVQSIGFSLPEIVYLFPVKPIEALQNYTWKGCEMKIDQLRQILHSSSSEVQGRFLDLNDVIKVSQYDGLHFDTETHTIIGEQLAVHLSKKMQK
ncbi:MAG: SGNH/GDSL hydrolase family protein [Patescibacteria group bacterium]